MDEGFDYHPVADTLDDEAAVVCLSGRLVGVVITLSESARDIYCFEKVLSNSLG